MMASPSETPPETAPEVFARGARGLSRRILLVVIHLYQAARMGRPSPCRFIPSCSAYGEEAVTEHGAFRGAILTVKRIARCRPGGGSGVDLVPPRSS